MALKRIDCLWYIYSLCLAVFGLCLNASRYIDTLGCCNHLSLWYYWLYDVSQHILMLGEVIMCDIRITASELDIWLSKACFNSCKDVALVKDDLIVGLLNGDVSKYVLIQAIKGGYNHV